MLLDLSEAIRTPGTSIPFSVAIDLCDLQYGASCAVTEPVRAEGSVRNHAGTLILSGSVSAVLHGQCDRCCETLEQALTIPFEVVLEDASGDHEDVWVFPIQENRVDLAEIVRTVFVLNMDSRFLCREDCLGLCPQCGKNLNEGPCGCTAEPDERLSSLSKLLKE